MDGVEDSSRYSSKPYDLDNYNNLSRRHKNSIKNASYSRVITNRHEDAYEDVVDDDFNEFGYESDVNDEREGDGGGQNAYTRNFEYDDHFERNSRKRKLKNSVEGYELVRRAIPRELNSSVEWSEHAIFVLLEVWGDRFLQLGRKSLRSEDWNDVAEKVSEVSKIERTEMQCRTMFDSLKIRYKKEKGKVGETGLNSSRWPYFKKMDMLMAASSRQEGGLACGVDSGEFVFMNTRVYLDRSNGFDEMRDSPGESEVSDEDNEFDDFPPRRMNFGGNEEEDSSLRVLADSIQKFGEIYEKIECSKREQMMELEKMRLNFHRELEVQKKHILEKAQSDIARIREEEDEDDDNDYDEAFSDASKENFSG